MKESLLGADIGYLSDPVYQEFRRNIKDRDHFLFQGEDEMEMDTRIKVWKVKRDIENDTKKKDAKRSKREKAK